MDPAPDPPTWALEDGILDKPRELESFRAYWTRHGYGDAVECALEVPNMANLRLGHEVRMRHLDRFDMHVCSRLLQSGGRFHGH